MKTEKLMAIIDRVVKDKVEVTIRITPDEEEITVEPWKPYEMKYPYQVQPITITPTWENPITDKWLAGITCSKTEAGA